MGLSFDFGIWLVPRLRRRPSPPLPSPAQALPLSLSRGQGVEVRVWVERQIEKRMGEKEWGALGSRNVEQPFNNL